MIRTAHAYYTGHPRPSTPVADPYATDEKTRRAHMKAKRQRLITELKALGVSSFGLMYSEMNQLADILHDNEVLKGVVYGRYTDGFAVLAATDRRVLFIDKKPLLLKADEITYGLVGGVSFGKVGPLATVTLHTRIGDYKIKTLNFVSAQYFIDFIEERCLEHVITNGEYSYDRFA
jgi:hypothetical protein